MLATFRHFTQKPLRLLYRAILVSTRNGKVILATFAGSCTAGIAANLLGRKFIGIEKDKDFYQLGLRRRHEIDNPKRARSLFMHMSENLDEVQVLVNHVRANFLHLMVEKGITYLRAKDSKGSVLVTPGFEKLGYVLLHTNGKNCHLYKLCRRGLFSDLDEENVGRIWLSSRECILLYGISF